VDVGCGVGTWLAEFRRRAVEDVLGVDGAYVERSMLEIPAERFVAGNLDESLALGRRFDLALSLEVAEHLPPASADAFVASLTSLGPIVVFSAAIPGQGGNGHVNEAWPESWARRFAARGYRWADPLRTLFWNDPRVEPWYAQNLLVFHRPDAFEVPPWGGAGIGGSEWPLPLVHPKFFVRLADRRPTVRRAWREFRRAIRAGFSGGAGG
jgi:SAM-dependent methyltransferase